MTFHLSFQRIVPVTAADLYRGWTEPELMLKWFTPAPWRTLEAEVDARPGGIFRTVMCGPDGERNEGTGCVLEAVAGRRFSWTNILGPDFEPKVLGEGEFGFTATLEFEDVEGGARYQGTVRHFDAASQKQHDEMGFVDGWNAALDQLVVLLS